MPIVLIAVLGLFVSATPIVAGEGLADSVHEASAMCADNPRLIRVTGQGEASAEPDLAIISFAVDTTAPTAAAAVEANAQTSKALADRIKTLLGKDDRVSTTRYSLDPVYDHHRERNRNEPPEITGYVARNEVRVETRTTAAVGKLIDNATRAGANRVSNLVFTLRDRKSTTAQAQTAAARDAQDQAATIAAALGVELGPILEASTATPASIVPRHYRGAAMAMESSAPTPVEPGDVRVTATLHVVYAIR